MTKSMKETLTFAAAVIALTGIVMSTAKAQDIEAFDRDVAAETAQFTMAIGSDLALSAEIDLPEPGATTTTYADASDVTAPAAATTIQVADTTPAVPTRQPFGAFRISLGQ